MKLLRVEFLWNNPFISLLSILILILSSVINTNKPQEVLLSKDDRSNIVESFRVLVTNLVFSLAHIEDKKSKTILLTSTIAGEGKTFLASNLSSFLAYSNHKVVILGMDFRAPKLSTYFTNNTSKGITHFIKDNSLSIDDIINKSSVEGLDVIFPGIIAPVFLDITKSERFNMMMSQLKERYEYVIIDSAPIGLVSETLAFAPFVDMCLFVIRANHLDKRILKISNKLYNEKRFPDYRSILNGVNMNVTGYGYGYGYGYGVEPDFSVYKYKPWKKEFWQFHLQKIKNMKK